MKEKSDIAEEEEEEEEEEEVEEKTEENSAGRISDWLDFFATGNTLLCDWRFEPAKRITTHIEARKHFFNIF